MSCHIKISHYNPIKALFTNNYRFDNENGCEENKTCHHLTSTKYVKTNFMSPYAKHMYTRECPKQIRTFERHQQVKLISDGRLYIQYETHVEIFTKGFCLENFYDSESGKVFMSAFKCKTENLTLYLSLPQTPKLNGLNSYCNFESLHRWLRFAFTFCGFVSLPFLILSLFFYITLPELGNFQGNIICAYIISTLLTTIFLIVIYNVSSDGDDSGTEFFVVVSQTTCKAMGYLLYCSGLLMFTWMSVLCFDLLR